MSLRELVAIRWPSGKRALIAREDYDPARHTLWESPSPVPSAPGEALDVYPATPLLGATDDALLGQRRGRGRPRKR